jgi:ubiquinone/menaquinone biosynthesis C-methylase UbiE
MGSAEIQGELWGRHPRTWAAFQEAQMRPLYEATLGALEPLDGRSLLDAGCGTGLAVRLAADRGAVVSGLDASGPLLEVARERTPQASLRTGDIQALPYDDAAFDVVMSFNAIEYATDPAAAVAQLARVCRSGGQVAIGCGATRPDARPRRCSPGCARSPRRRPARPRRWRSATPAWSRACWKRRP